MSIEDSNGREIVRLGTLHAWAFKIGLYAMPLGFAWLVNTISTDHTEIDRHDSRITYLENANKALADERKEQRQHDERREDQLREQISDLARSLEGVKSQLHGVSTLVGKSREDVKRTIANESNK